jgi:hypothetical protein
MLNLKAVQVKEFNKEKTYLTSKRIQTKNYEGGNSHSEIHPVVYCIMYSTKHKNQGNDKTKISCIK